MSTNQLSKTSHPNVLVYIYIYIYIITCLLYILYHILFTCIICYIYILFYAANGGWCGGGGSTLAPIISPATRKCTPISTSQSTSLHYFFSCVKISAKRGTCACLSHKERSIIPSYIYVYTSGYP